ncbi:MAG: transporter related protein [Frankiales bacterium]|nr:transporter related protein [Frankiales bacterium]
MTSPQYLLSVKDLEVRYGPALAINNLTLEVKPGEVIALLGSNGAGKSTLARTISGLVPVASGSITFEGHDISKRAAYHRRLDGILYLPEGRGVFPGLSVTENLRLASNTLARSKRKAAIDEAMTVFPNLAARRSTKAGMLSGGEQQMLSLARALTVGPKLLIADEMSLGLAPKLVDTVFETLNHLKSTGVTIILIEQFIHRALAFADQCVVMSRGNLAWQGPAAGAHQEVLTRYLGESAMVG